jgi:triosephosphate isomerase
MDDSGIKIIPVVSALDAVRIMDKVKIEVYLQHIDCVDEGAKSGMVSALQAMELGVKGSLLNHSEHRLPAGTILKILASLPTCFKSVVCLQSLGQTDKWAKNIKTGLIAYEPKQFIGSREKSVASEKPEVIKKMVEKYLNLPVLIGAGVHSKEDVVTSLGLGAKGILVATDVVLAKDPKKELVKLVDGFSV